MQYFPFFLIWLGFEPNQCSAAVFRRTFLRGRLIPIILYTAILFISQYRPTVIMYKVCTMCHPALASGSQPTGWRPPLSPGHSWQSDDRGSEVPGPLPPLHPSLYFARSFMRHFIHVQCGAPIRRVAVAVMVCRRLCSVALLLGVFHCCKYHLTPLCAVFRCHHPEQYFVCVDKTDLECKRCRGYSFVSSCTWCLQRLLTAPGYIFANLLLSTSATVVGHVQGRILRSIGGE